MTKHTDSSHLIDSGVSGNAQTSAREIRKGKTMQCGYKMAEGICGATIHESATSYTGLDHDIVTSWLHFATTEVTAHPRFLKCAACGKLPDDNPQHFLLEGGHRFINEGVL